MMLTTIKSLKKLSIALGCGEAEGDTTSEVIEYMAENNTPGSSADTPPVVVADINFDEVIEP